MICGASKGIGEEFAYQYMKFGTQLLLVTRQEAVLQNIVAHCGKLIGCSNYSKLHVASECLLLRVPCTLLLYVQRAKKVVSDSLGLVDFAIGLVIFALNLPDGQVLFFWGNSNYRRIVINPANQKGFWAN